LFYFTPLPANLPVRGFCNRKKPKQKEASGMSIIINVLMPIFLIFAAGYVLQKTHVIDIKSVSTLAIYILSPCLVFRTFYTETFDSNYVSMIVFSLLLAFILILINKILIYLLKIDKPSENGLMLSTVFMNAGNFGAPLMLFAFGEQAFAYAIVFMVIQSLLMNTFGVYIASRDSSSIFQSVRTVTKIPALYAMVIAVTLQAFNITLSETYFGAIDLVANATIPVVMIILGMQLARLRFEAMDWSKMGYGVIVRLIVSPLVAWGLVSVLPMDPVLQKVLILSAAMPTAATITMFAVQFNARPQLVSSITFATTTLSVLTLWGLLVMIA
jgi:malate permease and related proteins